jgi:IclR family acetate operon transcriptional repressor
LLATTDRVDWSLDDISTGLALPKSTAHRLLETLVSENYVVNGPGHGFYRLGLRAAVVGGSAIRVRRPKEDVRALIDAASRETGETVGLSVRDGTMIVIIERALPPRPLKWNLGVGGSTPAHATAAGKVLLAAFTNKEVEGFYGRRDELQRFTPRTVASVADLIAQLELVRERGFALDDEELELGLRCVALPVISSLGTTHALGIQGPSSRVTIDYLTGLVDGLRQVAEKISLHISLVEEH